MSKKVVIIGGGWSGISAAIISAKKGMHVVLIEKTDMLMGTGLVGGIMRNNGRYTGAQEAILMGASELFEICDSCSVHRNLSFPMHNHAFIYDPVKVLAEIKNLLKKYRNNLEVIMCRRVKSIQIEDKSIVGVVLDDRRTIYGDAFIDCTGTAGPISICKKYGNGCVMCIMRCPTFGGRVSISEMVNENNTICISAGETIGAMSGSCKIDKTTVDKNIVDKIEKNGYILMPIPHNLPISGIPDKACQQYKADAYEQNVVMLDAGSFIKVMRTFIPLSVLHSIKGFEKAKYADPYSGGVGNSIRFVTVSVRDNYMRVLNTNNLFCAGERSGAIVGHTEAIITGALAGCNASNYLLNKELLELSTQTACGDMINFSNRIITSDNRIYHKITMSGSIYFNRMKKINLYTTDDKKIEQRINALSYKDIFVK